MKILILEDSNEKYMALVRVLKRCGEENVSWVGNRADGLALLQEAAQSGKPFDLAITDMHYPPAPAAPGGLFLGDGGRAGRKRALREDRALLLRPVSGPRVRRLPLVRTEQRLGKRTAGYPAAAAVKRHGEISDCRSVRPLPL